MSDVSDCEREVQDLSNPQVLDKYKTASEISNNALKLILSRCVPGASAYSLCVLGDAFMEAETKKVFQKKDKSKKKLEKGIAFPCCISVNEICANLSPTEEVMELFLRRGDLVKVDLGVHIDGYISVAGHTAATCVSNAQVYAPPTDVAAFSVPAAAAPSAGGPAVAAAGEEAARAAAEAKKAEIQGEAEQQRPLDKLEGRAADVIQACWVAAEAAIREIGVGKSSVNVTKIIEVAAKEFNCMPMQGVLCHQLKRHVIEGTKCFTLCTAPTEEKVDEFVFEPNEVYGVDIVISTGEGRARQAAYRTSVFRRQVEKKYILKSQLGRHFMNEVENKYPTLPFSLRQLSDSRACKVGVAEAMRHELLLPYPVMTERQGEFTAQFKFTVHVLPTGTKKVGGLSFSQERLFSSSYEVQDEHLKALLATSLNPKKNKKKSKDAVVPDA